MATVRPSPERVRQTLIGIPNDPVTPGTQMELRIITHYEQPIRVVEFKVEVLRRDEMNPLGHSAKVQLATMTYQRNERCHQNHIVCRRVIIDGVRYVMHIPDGDRRNNEVSVTLNVPAESPDSWQGNHGMHGSIRYTVVSTLSYKRLEVRDEGNRVRSPVHTIITVKDLSVHNHLLIDPRVPLRSHREMETFVSKKLKKGELTAELKVPACLLLGQHFQAFVQLTNDTSRAVTSASLTLYQRLTISNLRITGSPEEALNSMTVPDFRVAKNTSWGGYIDGLHVPAQGLSSASFSGLTHLSVRFFVRLKLHLKWKGCLKCDVYVKVGTDPVPSENSQHADNVVQDLFVRHALEDVPEE